MTGILRPPVSPLASSFPIYLTGRHGDKVAVAAFVLLVGYARRPQRPRVVWRQGLEARKLSRDRQADGPESPPSGALEIGQLKPLLERISLGEAVSLLWPRRDLTLGWDDELRALWIGDLRGEGKSPVADFCVEVFRGSEVLWKGSSRQGRVWIPPEKLEEALEAGADQMTILAREEGESE